MKLDAVKDLIARVAPTVGAAIGGPLGGVAGKIVQDVLGYQSTDQVITALQSDPSAVLKLKEAEIAFERFLVEADIRKEEIAAADTHSARDLAKLNMRPQMALSTLFIGGYFVIFLMVISGALVIDAGVKEMAFILIGVMAGEMPRIMQFWFGSSLGSKEKTAQIVNAK